MRPQLGIEPLWARSPSLPSLLLGRRTSVLRAVLLETVLILL